MTIQTYWDIPERERARMTEEQVRAYVPFELMTKGCVRPSEPEYLDETAPTLAKETWYQVELDGTDIDVAFHSEDDAYAFAALKPRLIVKSWETNWLSSTKPPVQLVRVMKVDLPPATAVETNKEALKAAAKAKDANEQMRREHAKELAAFDGASRDIWNDWREQRSTETRMVRVLKTYNEYLELAGDDGDVAGRFLAKAFPRDEIVQASEWLAVDFHLPPAVDGEPPPPPKLKVVKTKEDADGLPF